MARKKKNDEANFDDMLMGMLGNMLDNIPPDMRDAFVNKLNECAAEGKDILDIQNEMYEYQRPDYTKSVQPLAECLMCLHDAVLPTDAQAAYARVHDEMKKLPKDSQERMLRNYLMNVLADGLTRDFENENEKSCLHLFVVFQLIDDFELTNLFDVILETMKQAPNFFHFYYSEFEDVAIWILARVGVNHLEELKKLMFTDGFVLELHPIIFNAVVQMAIDNPFYRLQVLAWTSDVLKSGIGKSILPLSMDSFVLSLAQIKAVELLPMIKSLYKEYSVPSVEIKGGIKGVTRLLTKGTNEVIVNFVTIKELLERLKGIEAGDFDDEEADNAEENFNEWWDDDDDNMDEQARNVRDADALFHKELNKSRRKKGQRCLYTLDVTLKGSPRKVYRQLTVPSDLALNHLGEILVRAVGWDGYHLNQFIKGKNDYYVMPDENGFVDFGENASKYTIGDLLTRIGCKIQWEYDFGDSWIHEIKLVEKVATDVDTQSAVMLVKATGACPPEDCGGICGYRHLLSVLKDPSSEEYEEMREWLGGDFNPKSFSLSLARERIARYVKNL